MSPDVPRHDAPSRDGPHRRPGPPAGSPPVVVPLDPARAGDAIRILALLHAAYEVEARLLGAGRFPPLERTLASVMRSESAWSGVVDGDALVAAVEVEEHDGAAWRDDGRPAGGEGDATDGDDGAAPGSGRRARPSDGPGLLIASLVVEPARFREGLARALVRHVIDLASERGDLPVRASTAAANEPAAKLYLGMGFREVGGAERGGFPLTRFERVGTDAP